MEKQMHMCVHIRSCARARARTHGCECESPGTMQPGARGASLLFRAPQNGPSSVQTRRLVSTSEAAPSLLSEQFPCCGLERGTQSPSSVPASKTKPPRKANLVPLSTLKAGCHINNPHNRPIRSIHSVLVFSSPQLLFQSCASLYAP